MIKNYYLKNKNSRRGFTLIEIMIVIAIVGILASITIVNSGKNTDRDMKLEADRLVTFLRSVQSMALSGEQVSEDDVPSCWNTAVTPHKYICKVCGYGIRMDGNNIEVYFAQRDTMDRSCIDFTYITYPDYTNKVFYPQNDVTIGGLGTDEILFMMPNGKIYKKNETEVIEASGNIVINLSKTGAPASVDVTITPNGIIGY